MFGDGGGSCGCGVWIGFGLLFGGRIGGVGAGMGGGLRLRSGEGLGMLFFFDLCALISIPCTLTLNIRKVKKGKV